MLRCPQVDLPTEHVLAAGLYARTLRIPAGTVVVGVLVKVPTLLVIHGQAELLTSEGWMSVDGYQVLQGSPMRKQVCVARSDVQVTMVFATSAKSVDEAEREFTDEWETLMTRRNAGE